MQERQPDKSDRNPAAEGYVKKPVTYKVIDLEVHPKPLKLRWKILSYDINRRLNNYAKKAGGFTDDEMNDPEYAALVNAYERSFFSASFDPKAQLAAADPTDKHELTGPENLAELLALMVEEDVDWAKFISDNSDRYNEIRNTGLEMYYDFFFEVMRLQEM